MASTADYDAPRRPVVDLDEDSLEELRSRRAATRASAVDLDEAESTEGFELPGADMSDEELSVTVVPIRPDEFRCGSCFLVHHRSQFAERRRGLEICRECV